jgi:phosphoglycolate phosphatase
MAHLFFDLDGTLLDPSEGFVLSLGHAFRQCGLASPSDHELRSAIGPPADEWSRLFGEARLPNALLPDLIREYRTHYEAVGLFQQRHYPGLLATLQSLEGSGHRLSIATSKPQKQAETTLDHFGLSPLFIGRIFGRDLTQPGDKTTILSRALQCTGALPDRSIMIGDREFDCIAARNLGLRSIGVLYGFGSEAELIQAGAHRLCPVPEELPAQILALQAPN